MNKKIFLLVLIFLLSSSLSATVQPLIIGLGGGVGSGKSTLAQKIKELFPQYVEVIAVDDFPMYTWQELTEEEQKTYDFDHPSTINYQKMADTIDSLFVGTKVQCPDWSFCNQTRPAGTFWKPRPVIILEGFHLYHDKRIYDLFSISAWNLACFIDVSEEEDRITRIIARNLKDRNESEEDSRRRYLSHIKPSYQEYIKPTERYAHVTIHNNDKETFQQAVTIIADHIERFLTKQNIQR